MSKTYKIIKTRKGRECQGQVFTEESKLNTLGYINRNQKIKNYMQAGLQLHASRIEQYDASGDAKDSEFMYNPFRDVGMDFSDLKRQKDALEKLIQKKKETHDLEVLAEEKRLEKLKKNEEVLKSENQENLEAKKASQTDQKAVN